MHGSWVSPEKLVCLLQAGDPGNGSLGKAGAAYPGSAASSQDSSQCLILAWLCRGQWPDSHANAM